MNSGMMVLYRWRNISRNKYGASAKRAAVSRFGRCFTYDIYDTMAWVALLATWSWVMIS